MECEREQVPSRLGKCWRDESQRRAEKPKVGVDSTVKQRLVP